MYFTFNIVYVLLAQLISIYIKKELLRFSKISNSCFLSRNHINNYPQIYINSHIYLNFNIEINVVLKIKKTIVE
jgi:hypothetical protein